MCLDLGVRWGRSAAAIISRSRAAPSLSCASICMWDAEDQQQPKLWLHNCLSRQCWWWNVTTCAMSNLLQISDSNDQICTRPHMPVLTAVCSDFWLESASSGWRADFQRSETSVKVKKSSFLFDATDILRSCKVGINIMARVLFPKIWLKCKQQRSPLNNHETLWSFSLDDKIVGWVENSCQGCHHGFDSCLSLSQGTRGWGRWMVYNYLGQESFSISLFVGSVELYAAKSRGHTFFLSRNLVLGFGRRPMQVHFGSV